MNKVLTGIAALCFASVSQAVLIDDFSGDLSNYTFTTILNNSGGANTTAGQITDGKLEFNTTSYGNIDQSALIYNGLSLAVGQEVQTDFDWTSTGMAAGSSIGLYVGQTPVAGTRANYVNVYMENSTKIKSRGFSGSSELSNIFFTKTGVTKLFIARDGVDDWEAGYYNAAGDRFIIADRNNLNTGNNGAAVGFYTDVRSTGTLSELDNLSVIPEPATLGLIAMSAGAMLVIRRRFII